jgi:hypothetical protein
MADVALSRGVVLRLGWLAPVTASVLLIGVLFSQHNGAAAVRPGSSPLVAMILSNHSGAAFLTAKVHSGQNGIPANTFEWTNRGAFTSSIPSLSPGKGIY